MHKTYKIGRDGAWPLENAPEANGELLARPRVAVIIPTLNEASRIRDCIESLERNQLDGISMEIVIVDGGSSDGTKEIVSDFKSRFTNVRMIEAVGENLSHSRNLGISSSKADIIINFSGHVTAPENFIRTLVRTLVSSSDEVAGVGCSQRLSANETSLVARAAFSISESMLGGRLIRPYQSSRTAGPVASVAFCAYRKKVLEKVGPFDVSNSRGDDADLNLRIRKAGYKLLLTPETFVFYAPRNSLAGFWSQMFGSGRARTRIIVKNHALRMQAGGFSYLALMGLPVYTILLMIAFGVGLPVRSLLVASLAVYLVLLAASSAKLAFEWRKPSLFFLTILMYFMEHFGYGLGMDFELIASLRVNRPPSSGR